MTAPHPGREESAAGGEVPEIALSDEDILDAMRHIPGYLDITTDDFREIYHLAHQHAAQRLLRGLRAGSLMRPVASALAPGMMLDEAARRLVAGGLKALPVADDAGRVVGMLTETDYLRHLQAATFLELLLRIDCDPGETGHRCHETTVREAMSAPVVTVGPEAGLREIMAAFRRHEGRSMPVVDAEGRLRGLLLRKDFLDAIDRAVHR